MVLKMNYLDDIDFEDVAKKVIDLALIKANNDLEKLRKYLDKNKSMKFKIGEVVKKTRFSVMDGLMNEHDEYYVISPFEYNVDWNNEVNYYLTRSDKSTLLGVRESEIEHVNLPIDSIPNEVKKIYFHIGGVKIPLKSFTSIKSAEV